MIKNWEPFESGAELAIEIIPRRSCLTVRTNTLMQYKNKQTKMNHKKIEKCELVSMVFLQEIAE